MPSSPMLYHSGLGLIVAIPLLALMASSLTLLVSTFLMWLYRRAVAKLMSAQGGIPDPRIDNDTHPDRMTSLSADKYDSFKSVSNPLTSDNPFDNQLYRWVNSGPYFHACKYAIAGLLFALILGGASYFAFSQTQISYLRAAAHPLQFLFMFWTFSWPIVITTAIFVACSRRNIWLVILGYFIVLVLLVGIIALIPTEVSFRTGNTMLPAWSGETPVRLLNRWNLFNFAPTILVIAFRYRRVRAIAPLVLSFMTVLSAGVLSFIAAAFLYLETSVTTMNFVAETFGLSDIATVIGYFFFLFVLACLLFGVIGWWLIVWIRSAYLGKTVSDQSLAVDALWLIYASFYAVMLAFAGPGWALTALMGFFVFKNAVNVGNKWLLTKNDTCLYNPSLLVLRVFAIGKRSELLFNAVTQRWRHIGNVRLIAGTDLALSTVAPHQFLAFVSGKLNRLFIGGESAIDSSLAELDAERDSDGRFRINDFFCHADTWQSVLKKLVNSTDVVLMDLRSFSESNAGCVYEIVELLNTVPLRRLIFVVDDSTDNAFLKETLAQGCRELRSSSPNLGISESDVLPFELKSSKHSEVQRLIRKLCAAVDSG